MAGQVALDAPCPGATDGGGAVVAAEQQQRSPVAELEGPLQAGEVGKQGIAQPGDGTGAVGHQIAAMAQQQAQRGSALIGGAEGRQPLRPQACVLSDGGGITGIVLGLADEHRARAVDGQAGDVADALARTEQHGQGEGHRTFSQIDGEERLTQGTNLTAQRLELALLVGDHVGEQLPSLAIEGDGEMALLADIDADEHVHQAVLLSALQNAPTQLPPSSPYAAPQAQISISGRKLAAGRVALPCKRQAQNPVSRARPAWAI